MSESDMNKSTALQNWQVNDDLSLVPLTPNEAQQRRQLMIQFIRDAMKEGRDYGVIPGTSERSLWKPGAEKLCTFFGYSFRILPVETILDWTGKDHDGEPFFFFRHKCELRHGAILIGESEGSCNSWEKKYRWRDGKRKCPKCGKESVYKSKPRENDPPGKPMGFYCWTKQGGCGATFPANDQSITEQQVGPVKNDNIFDQVNTLQKMSEKRALVGTTVIACNASEFFSLDFDEEGAFEELGNIRPVITRDDLQATPETVIEIGRRASETLRGDQGDLGPMWAEQPTQAKIMQSAPEPPKPSTEIPFKAAINKCPAFTTWCNVWVQKYPQYAKEHTPAFGADMRHILGRVGKLKFAEVTSDNMQDVQAALDDFVRGKVDPAAGETQTPF